MSAGATPVGRGMSARRTVAHCSGSIDGFSNGPDGVASTWELVSMTTLPDGAVAAHHRRAAY